MAYHPVLFEFHIAVDPYRADDAEGATRLTIFTPN